MSDDADNPKKASSDALAASRSNRALRDGRVLSLSSDERGDLIEVTSADGQLELSIAITESGPVLRLKGARLEIDSSDTVAVDCKKFELRTQEGFDIRAGGDIGMRTGGDVRVKSDGQTFIDGDWVNINCLDRTGYHDDPARAERRPDSQTTDDTAQETPDAAQTDAVDPGTST